MKNIKIIIIILVSLIVIFGLTSYAYKLNANDVTYDKKTTTLESNTVSGAIDELGVLATTSMSEVKNQLNSIEAKIDNISVASSENKIENASICLAGNSIIYNSSTSTSCSIPLKSGVNYIVVTTGTFSAYTGSRSNSINITGADYELIETTNYINYSDPDNHGGYAFKSEIYKIELESNTIITVTSSGWSSAMTYPFLSVTSM